MMPGITDDGRQRLIARLRAIGEEHRHQPDIAPIFLRLADNIAGGREPGFTAEVSGSRNVQITKAKPKDEERKK
jgi:hypothetical protein